MLPRTQQNLVPLILPPKQDDSKWFKWWQIWQSGNYPSIGSVAADLLFLSHAGKIESNPYWEPRKADACHDKKKLEDEITTRIRPLSCKYWFGQLWHGKFHFDFCSLRSKEKSAGLLNKLTVMLLFNRHFIIDRKKLHFSSAQRLEQTSQ